MLHNNVDQLLPPIVPVLDEIMIRALDPMLTPCVSCIYVTSLDFSLTSSFVMPLCSDALAATSRLPPEFRNRIREVLRREVHLVPLFFRKLARDIQDMAGPRPLAHQKIVCEPHACHERKFPFPESRICADCFAQQTRSLFRVFPFWVLFEDD